MCKDKYNGDIKNEAKPEPPLKIEKDYNEAYNQSRIEPDNVKVCMGLHVICEKIKKNQQNRKQSEDEKNDEVHQVVSSPAFNKKGQKSDKDK